MKVYLLNVGPRSGEFRPLFFALPDPEGREADRRVEQGSRGWAVARLRRLRDTWHHSQGGASRFTRHAWDWLHRRTHPDETLLARLRSAKSIEVHHPPALTTEEVQAAWTAFLRRGRIRHWVWFLVNLAISPFTVLFMPLPGPNLIGYWFAYRAVHHWLILVGLGRARVRSVETAFHPTTPLEVAPDAIHCDALGIDPDAVRAFLARHGFRHEAQESSTP